MEPGGEVGASWADQMEALCKLEPAPSSLQSQQNATLAVGDGKDIFDLDIDDDETVSATLSGFHD